MPSVQYFMVERAEINKRIVLYSDVQFYSLRKYRPQATIRIADTEKCPAIRSLLDCVASAVYFRERRKNANSPQWS